MAAPFSTKSHTTAEIEKISNEIKETIKNTQWDGNDVLKVELRIDVCGHGVRPFGDYANGAYRDFSISIGRKEWNGLTKADLMAIGKSIKNIDGFEVESKDIYVEYGKMMPDFSYPTYYRKYGNACDEWGELCKLVSKKYGIKLNVKDLYLVRMSGTIKDQEVGDDDYGYVVCTQRNDDNVGLEEVMRVFVDEDDNIMLELEYYGSYDIDDVDTQDIVSLAEYLHQRYDE